MRCNPRTSSVRRLRFQVSEHLVPAKASSKNNTHQPMPESRALMLAGRACTANATHLTLDRPQLALPKVTTRCQQRRASPDPRDCGQERVTDRAGSTQPAGRQARAQSGRHMQPMITLESAKTRGYIDGHDRNADSRCSPKMVKTKCIIIR